MSIRLSSDILNANSILRWMIETMLTASANSIWCDAPPSCFGLAGLTEHIQFATNLFRFETRLHVVLANKVPKVGRYVGWKFGYLPFSAKVS